VKSFIWVGRVWYVERSLLTKILNNFWICKNLFKKVLRSRNPVVNAVVVEEKFDTVTLPEVVAPVVSSCDCENEVLNQKYFISKKLVRLILCIVLFAFI
jgi:hypothetical protein